MERHKMKDRENQLVKEKVSHCRDGQSGVALPEPRKAGANGGLAKNRDGLSYFTGNTGTEEHVQRHHEDMTNNIQNVGNSARVCSKREREGTPKSIE